MPTGQKQLTGLDIVEQLKNALSTPYTGEDPRKIGLTKGAAALLALAEKAQDGDGSALELLLNRLMGKPVQQVNQLTASASLKEFLDHLSLEVAKVENPFDVPSTPATPSGPPPEDVLS